MNTKKTLLSITAQNIDPYQWEEITDGQVLRFDANTIPNPPPAIRKFTDELNKFCPINEYSDPAYKKLKSLIANYEGVIEDMITITNSGDEAIDILAKTFLNPGDGFITAPPTYEMFEIQCGVNNGILVEVPLRKDTWEVDTGEIIKRSNNGNIKIIFLVNPNNPTGSIISQEIIKKIVNNCESLVVVDEVYREFYGISSVPFLKQFNNLVILRSFSKFAGLAGARIGYLIANQFLSRKFDAIRLPMGVGFLSYKLAEMVLEKDKGWMMEQAAMIIKERKKLTEELKKLGFYIYPSYANFLLVKIGDKASETSKRLKEKGIIIRDRSNKKYLEGCVRITVRSSIENQKLIEVLKKIKYES